MALNLSITSFVIISLSTIALVLGIILFANIAFFSKQIIETDLPAPNTNSQLERLDVTVTPPTSQKGTVFAIVANTWPKSESQDLYLTIKKDSEELPLILFDDGNHYDEKAKDGIYGSLFNSQNLDLGEYFIIDSNQKKLASFTIHEPGCEPLIGSPSTDKINFIVLPSGYTDMEDFKQDVNDIVLGRDSIYGIEPFKSDFSKFAFSFSQPSQDLKCEVGCRGVPNMICCDDLAVSNEASQCHYDGIIVLENSEVNCGTSSFYSRVCAKSENANLILAHELGHSFGGLADEYIYSENFASYNIPESYVLTFPNCDEAGCPKWADKTSSCYAGCTSPNLYRSSENSIMRAYLFGQFNLVSADHLEQTIQEHLTKESEIKSSNFKSYSLNMNYVDGEVKLSPVSLMPVRAGVLSTNGFFTATIKDKNQQILFESKIPLPILEQPAMEISDTPFVNEQLNLPIVLPYLPTAETLEISDEEKILAKTSLAVFSDTCGNKICDASENQISCSADCNETDDNFCESGICDPDCPNFTACSSQNKNYFWPAAMIIVALILIAVVIIRSRKTNKQEK